MVEKNTYRIVDIFREEPSEQEPQDSLDESVNRDIEQAKKIAGEELFDKRVEEFRLSFLSRRENKNSMGNAQPLNERSFQIAAAISIIRERDSQTAKTTYPTRDKTP